MTSSRVLETAIAVAMFAAYVGLWSRKRSSQRKATGVDPEVLARATTPLQAYFARLIGVITAVVVAILALHAVAPATWPPLVRVPALDGLGFDLAGAGVGFAGLALCAHAQAMMGDSWRVGIDAERRTALVTRGIYGLVRNPTYLGLHLVSLGLWLVWPTSLVAAYAVLFFVIMDIQVRAEEEHLLAAHGEAFRSYAAQTHRYLPGIY
jgi:protein-S-isoprenylcysteine O-methyltransferase Ste14